MTADDLIALNEQIAAMARAGLPLDQGLQSLAKELGRGQLRSVTEAIARDLRAGHPLPEALERQKGKIPPYYANLVTAGVQTGRLPEVLTTLSTYARSISATRTTIIEALLYPIIVLVLGFCLFAGISVYIIPQFKTIFDEFGMRLPWFTQAVLEIGDSPIEFILAPVVVLSAMVIGVWGYSRFSEHGHLIWNKLISLIPIIGPLIRAARLSAFAELLGMLVEYEVPLPLAFRLAGAASSDPLMVSQAAEVEDKLSEGLPIAEALRGRGLIPEWMAWLAVSGEKRGKLAPALREIATVYRRQVESRAAMLRSILPPFIVIFVAGILTAVFAISMLLPMVKLLEGLSR